MEFDSQLNNNEVDDEPPDGGTLAWLHVVAAHLIVFNAQ